MNIKMADQSIELLNNMIANVRELRLSATEMFITLADHGPDPQRSQAIFQPPSSHLHRSQSTAYHVRGQKPNEYPRHRDLIHYVGKRTSDIHNTIREIEQAVLELTSSISTNKILHESVHLAIDHTAERHNLYTELCKAFRTYDKLHEYSAHCQTLLNQQSLKRVYGGSRSSNTQSKIAQFNPYAYKMAIPGRMDHIIMTISKVLNNFKLTMEATYSRPFGMSTGVIQLTVNRVLKAVLVLRGIVIDAVIVKAYHETFAAKVSKATGVKSVGGNNLNRQKSDISSTMVMMSGSETLGSQFVDPDDDIDLWSESKFLVFRKLTLHANSATLHFQYPTFPEIALKSFLSWLNSYGDLFGATCTRCNTKLRKFLPPICRDFSTGFHPHHDSCK